MSVYVNQTFLPTTTDVSATADTTTTSGTDALINSMTLTPSAGTYLVFFDASMTSNSAGNAISYSYYVGGVQNAASLRKVSPFDGGTLSATTARTATSLIEKFTVDGTQAIEVRWSMSGGTATCHQRILTVTRVA